MGQITWFAKDEMDTERLGATLARVLPGGTTIALCGTLGSGKTRLVQAVAVACGVAREDVVSPTFILCQQYRGDREIYHLDAYRLRDEDEFLQLGPEEYFEGQGLTFVEWADRVAGCLPEERVEIQLEIIGNTARRFEIIGVGPRLNAVVDRLAREEGNRQ